MGLFGKKKGIPDGIRVMFYEGDLPGFICNLPCQILLQDDCLRFTKIEPYIEAKLPRDRIISIELFGEQDYMQKFKGNAGSVPGKNEISKGYYVIYYFDKEGNKKHIDVWATSHEAQKMWKLKEEFAKLQKSLSYEI